MKALINGILEWSMSDENTGEVRDGINLYYSSPAVYYENLKGVSGLYPAKCKISSELVNKHSLKTLNYPIIAELEFTAMVTPKGKSIAVLTDLKNIKSLKLFD